MTFPRPPKQVQSHGHGNSSGRIVEKQLHGSLCISVPLRSISNYKQSVPAIFSGLRSEPLLGMVAWSPWEEAPIRLARSRPSSLGCIFPCRPLPSTGRADQCNMALHSVPVCQKQSVSTTCILQMRCAGGFCQVCAIMYRASGMAGAGHHGSGRAGSPSSVSLRDCSPQSTADVATGEEAGMEVPRLFQPGRRACTWHVTAPSVALDVATALHVP